MTEIIQRMSENSQMEERRGELEADQVLECFLKFNPPQFQGKPNQEQEADTGIVQMENIFSVLTYSE